MAQNFQNGSMPPRYNGAYGSPYYQPPRNNGGGNKTLLTIIIVLLTALLVGGAVWLFMDSNNKKAEKQEQIVKQENDAKVKALQEENERLKEENAKKPDKVVVERKVQVPSSAPASGTPKVVVNGVGVRLRFGPGLNYGYLTWANGQNRAPAKGTRLEYIDETSEWYHVRYQGQAYYLSNSVICPIINVILKCIVF